MKELGSNKDIWNMFVKDFGFSRSSLARVLGIQQQSFTNIISRNTVIKLDQLVDICTAAGVEIKIGDYTINPEKWYAGEPNKYKRLNGYIANQREEAYKEYEAAKARVAELEKELGIE